MRRKILIFVMFLLMGFAFAGCDFFGGGTVTLPTTEAPTTVAPTTVAPTTVAPTTVAPTTVAPTTVAPTTGVTTTAGSSTTTTTTSGTTTTTTQASTTTTTTSQTTTTTTTLVGDEFDVTFLDWNGAIIDIVTVSPGGSATAPPDPIRPNTLSVVYTFTGWSGTFTNVQGDITVYATYSASPISNTSYTRADLLYVTAIILETTNEEVLDNMLDQMMVMMDLTTEQELFDMMSMLATLKQDMMMMDSAAEMQALLSKAQDLGFDDVLLGKVATNFIAMMIEEEENYLLEELQDLNENKDYASQQIIDFQAKIVLIEGQVNDYCVTTSDETLCLEWWNTAKLMISLEGQYYSYKNELFNNDFLDYWLYSYLEYYLEEYLVAKENALDPLDYEDEYNVYMGYYNTIPSEHLLSYESVLAMYQDFIEAQLLLENQSNDLGIEANTLNEYFYGWEDEFGEYHPGYNYCYYELNYFIAHVEYVNIRILETTDEIAMFALVTSYFEDPLTAPKIQALVTMIYDGLYASAGVIDQEMIDFIEQFMMMLYFDHYFGMGTLQDIALSITAEEATYMINKLGDILVAFESTLTPEEYELMGDLLKEILPLAMMKPDMTPTEIDDLELMIAGLVDYYLPTLLATGSDFAHFLQSFTVEKTEALVSVVISIALSMEFGIEDHMIVQAASAFDIVFGDDSFDITLLANTFVDVYFLANFGPDHDYDLTPIKTAFVANITAIVALAADINAMNKMALTAADFAKIDELFIRAYTLIGWIENGFTDLTIDTTLTYSQEMIINLLDNLGLDSTATGISDITATLGAATEEEAYYLLRAMLNYTSYFINVRDFADIQAWFASINQFGLTEPEVIDLIFIMLYSAVDDNVNGLSPIQEYYLDEINFYQQKIAYETINLADYEQEILAYIATLPMELQADVTALWEAEKFAIDKFYVYNHYLGGLYGIMNWYDLDTIVGALFELYYLDPTDSNDLVDYNFYTAQFNNVYDLLPVDIQAMVDQLVVLHNNQMDAWTAKEELAYSIFNLGAVYDAIAELDDFIFSYQDSFNNATYYLLYIEQQNQLISEENGWILAIDQEAADLIATLHIDVRADFTALWEANKLEITSFHTYINYYYELYDYFNSLELDDYVGALEWLRTSDPSDPDYPTYQGQIDAFYDSNTPEKQAMLDQLELLFTTYNNAHDAAYLLRWNLGDLGTVNTELSIMNVYYNDYNLGIANLYTYQDELADLEELLADENQGLLTVNQAVVDYLTALPIELQADMSALWEAMRLDSEAQVEFVIYTNDLYDYISSYDVNELYWALYYMYYLDPSNLDEVGDYNESLDIFNGIYDAYASQPEIQLMILELQNLQHTYYSAHDEAMALWEEITSSEVLDTIYYDIEDIKYEYNYLISDLWYYQGEFEYYTILFDNYVYENYELEALYDLMTANPTLFKSVMAIILDDAQNVFATMPADSFAEVFDLARFVIIRHGEYEDFTPEDILALTQDLSAMLKLIGTTVDATDEAALALVVQTYIGYLADSMGMTGTVKDDFVLEMTGAINKYIGFAGITVDQFTLILDSLTIEQINTMVKFAHDAYSGRLTEFEMVIIGSIMIENMLSVTGFDIDLLTDMYFEVYVDMNYKFTYDEADLLAIQTEFSSFMADTRILITAVAAIDQNNMLPADIANIMELMDRMQWMFNYIASPKPTVLTNYEYVYDSADFTDLIMMVFKATETEAPAVITDIVALLGMTEEEAYYQVVGIMMVLKNLENVRSVSDVMSIYKGLRSVGLTNAEIAEYGMTLFMSMAYPNMLDSSSVSYYQTEIDWVESEIFQLELDTFTKETNLLADFNYLDETTEAIMLDIWDKAVLFANLMAPLQELIARLEMAGYNYDGYFYNFELKPLYLLGDEEEIQWLYWQYNLSQTEIDFYLQWHEIFNSTEYQSAMTAYNTALANIFDDYNLYFNKIEENFQALRDNNLDITRYTIQLEMYYQMLAEAEQELMMLTAIYNFLGDPTNQALVEDVLVILLDEIEVMSMDPNVKSLDMLLEFMKYPDLRYLDQAMMVEVMQSLSAMMANMGSTIDLADTTVIGQMLNAFVVEYVEAMEITDPIAEALMLAEYQAMVVTYLPQLLAMPDVLSSFLASMNEAKINEIMSILREYNWIRWYDENAELQEAIVSAKLVMAIIGDDSLDYEAVIEMIYGINYDLNDIQGTAPTMSVADMIAEVDALMLQAQVLVDIGLFGITLENEDDVLAFIAMMDSMFAEEIIPIPVI